MVKPKTFAEMLDKAPSYIVIIRCIHDRGETQRLALVELNRRGLWLSDEQRVQAGLASKGTTI